MTQVVSDFVAFTAGLWSWLAQENWFIMDLSLTSLCVTCKSYQLPEATLAGKEWAGRCCRSN